MGGNSLFEESYSILPYGAKFNFRECENYMHSREDGIIEGSNPISVQKQNDAAVF